MLWAVGDRFAAVGEDDREEEDGLSKQALVQQSRRCLQLSVELEESGSAKV